MVNITQEDLDAAYAKRSVEKSYYIQPTPINNIRPDHYGGAGNVYEVFNVLEAWNIDKDFYLGNVIKYVARAGKKDLSKTKEDLQKAMVYLQRKIDQL